MVRRIVASEKQCDKKGLRKCIWHLWSMTLLDRMECAALCNS